MPGMDRQFVGDPDLLLGSTEVADDAGVRVASAELVLRGRQADLSAVCAGSQRRAPATMRRR
jgi:hypothetical protein